MTRSKDKTRVVIVIPAYNEGGRIGQVVHAVRKQGYPQIVVVNDGSSDETGREAREAGATVLDHAINRGAGAATQTGFSYVLSQLDFDAVVTMDGDNQHEPADLDHMIEEHFAQAADLTIGNRFLQTGNDIPGKRVVFNRVANIVTSMFSWKSVSDSQSGFKVLSREALRKIHIELDGYEFCSEIIIKAHKSDIRIIDVPIAVYYTPESQQKGQSLINGIRTFSNLLQSVIFKSRQL